jgi:hypothetical protein
MEPPVPDRDLSEDSWWWSGGRGFFDARISKPLDSAMRNKPNVTTQTSPSWLLLV